MKNYLIQLSRSEGQEYKNKHVSCMDDAEAIQIAKEFAEKLGRNILEITHQHIGDYGFQSIPVSFS